MSTGTERQILRFAQATCQTHRDAIQEALDDLDSRRLTPDDLDRLGKADRRLLDQFAYRYTRLQDDMGAKLMPAILRSLGEDVAAMSVLDRMNRLEQLGWLPSADEWSELRRIHNESPMTTWNSLRNATSALCLPLPPHEESGKSFMPSNA